jgi:pSer/pThr/pTyr-binding forkhead associated (FHA) protein
MLKLVVKPSTTDRREFPLERGTIYAGRGNANDIKIEDPTVSNSHAQIIVEEGRVIIKDLGSKNGTYINGLPVTEGILQPGQSVRLGAVELIFQDDPPPPPEIVEGVVVKDPVVAEVLRAALERRSQGRKK